MPPKKKTLWRRGVETEIRPILEELGIALVPWSPLGSGFLTGTISSLPEDDFRNNNPRFQGDNFKANTQRFAPLMALAEELDVTPAQLSLAWLLHQGDHIIPIPGTTKRTHLESNIEALDTCPTTEDPEQINQIAPLDVAAGDRYPEWGMAWVNL